MIWASRCCDNPSRAEQRRQQVIATARKLFIDNGFHATGIAQIAKESGVAVGQLYRDFSSKEDIVAAIAQADCGRYMAAEALRAAIAVGDADSVRAWLLHFVEPESDPDDGRLFAEILAESSRNERIAAIFKGLQDGLKEQILTALALLAPGDALAERRSIVADLAITLSLGLHHHRLLQPELDAASMAETLGAMLDREIDAMMGHAPRHGA